VQEPEPCDPQTRYETPTKKTTGSSTVLMEDDAASSASSDSKKETRIKRDLELKKEPEEDEEGEEEEVEEEVKVEIAKPKGQRGRKRKSAVAAPVVEQEVIKTEQVKQEKAEAVSPPGESSAAAAVSPLVKQEATNAAPVPVRSELKKVRKMFIAFKCFRSAFQTDSPSIRNATQYPVSSMAKSSKLKMLTKVLIVAE
jgi:hypothetical protein